MFRFYQKQIQNSFFISKKFKFIRLITISQSDLVEKSLKIQNEISSLNSQTENFENFSSENERFLIFLFEKLNEIHKENPSNRIATSTKKVYHQNSSKFNKDFLQLEKQRIHQIDYFHRNQSKENLILIRLRYHRFLRLSTIYCYLTFHIQQTTEDLFEEILFLSKDFQSKSLIYLIEFNYYLYSLISDKNYFKIKKTLINEGFHLIEFLFENLEKLLKTLLSPNENFKENSILFNLIDEISLTLNCLNQIPKEISLRKQLRNFFFEYLYRYRLTSMKIIHYLIFIENSIEKSKHSNEINLKLFENYLIEICLHEKDFSFLNQILMLKHSLNYSNELFLRYLIQQINDQFQIQSKQISSIEIYSRFIYYLCSLDPTNLYSSRSTIYHLSEFIYKFSENQEKSFHQTYRWLIQCQYGMMFINMYNKNLLELTLNHQIFPYLLRDFGNSSLTIQRQLFEIYLSFHVDRSSIKINSLNEEILCFLKKNYIEYRKSIRLNQNSYENLLLDIKTSFENLYGSNQTKLIESNEEYLHVLYDFLEIDFNDSHSISNRKKKKYAIIPILNSMMIYQQRSNGQFYRLFNGPTLMRFRMIEKQNYQVLPIFQGQYLRAKKNNELKRFFENLIEIKLELDLS